MVAPPPDPVSAEAVTIVTGGGCGTGREIACGLGRRGFPVVVVYLRERTGAEAVVDAILAARGAALSMRAEVTDPLDVERVFDETGLTFGGVDVVVHAAARGAAVVLREAARRVRAGGVVADVLGGAEVTPALARELRARRVAVLPLAPAGEQDAVAALLAALTHWRDDRRA